MFKNIEGYKAHVERKDRDTRREAHPLTTREFSAMGTSAGVKKSWEKRQRAKPKAKYQPDLRNEHDNINNAAALAKLMRSARYMDEGVYTVHVSFGRAYVKKHKNPSSINYTAVGDSPMGQEGYWRMGSLYPFSKSTAIRYQNAGLGSE